VLEDLVIAEDCLNNRLCKHITGGESPGMADEST